ncbi:MAG: hypothetical protein GX565_02390 [Lentisphaerae bacterium]|nr:hypothetical protein [Lentisphaerota bacterium]
MSKNCRLDVDFYDYCLTHHNEVLRELDFVVANSLPVPYFGDLAAYLASPVRVLTAALNPSNREFTEPRFEVDMGLRGPVALESQLSAYFKVNPYEPWFKAFEPVLNGLEASYGGTMANGPHVSTALHVDMCSPIATSPTWSKLRPEQRAKLTITGRKIFEWLVDELTPNIIVASIGWAHLETWNADFEAGYRWGSLVKYSTTASGAPMKVPLLVQIKEIASPSGRKFFFVNASAANKPFGRFTTERKRAVGQKLLVRLRSAGSVAT